MDTTVQEIIYLSMIAASISFTVTETQILKPARNWIKQQNAFLGKLFHCGYCLGHWTAAALVLVYWPRIMVLWAPLDYVLTALVIAWLGGYQWALMCWLMIKAEK
jgi:hypothetical protein